MADAGTLFLDEITEMNPALQAKLLRVLQEGVIDRLGSQRSREVDLRIIAATNRAPRVAVQEGLLREDLFYRLNVFGVALPPLRERREDVAALARHFLRKYAPRAGGQALTASAEAALAAYNWPGNVRELENVMERATVLAQGGSVDCRHLALETRLADSPATVSPLTPLGDDNLDLERQVEILERRLIAQALAEVGDNKAKAARLLKVSERTLWYKLKKYQLGGRQMP